MGSDLTLATPWLPESFLIMGSTVGAGKREEPGWKKQDCQCEHKAWLTGTLGHISFCRLSFLICKADYKKDPALFITLQLLEVE